MPTEVALRHVIPYDHGNWESVGEYMFVETLIRRIVFHDRVLGLAPIHQTFERRVRAVCCAGPVAIASAIVD